MAKEAGSSEAGGEKQPGAGFGVTVAGVGALVVNRTSLKTEMLFPTTSKIPE